MQLKWISTKYLATVTTRLQGSCFRYITLITSPATHFVLEDKYRFYLITLVWGNLSSLDIKLEGLNKYALRYHGHLTSIYIIDITHSRPALEIVSPKVDCDTG